MPTRRRPNGCSVLIKLIGIHRFLVPSSSDRTVIAVTIIRGSAIAHDRYQMTWEDAQIIEVDCAVERAQRRVP
ncbi:protein of unknown function [Nitrospira japonica]|uniref:Uncharacterized protein n=1 Tax=Nitrospira japonica TaxID=1325564 RepID=A0A1W1I1K6_9BACT|nr:protein of unknown function [Nitrospira japonica]